MIAQLLFLLGAGIAFADHPDHDIFFTLMLCDRESTTLSYLGPSVAATRCGVCNEIPFVASVKFSCSDPNTVEVFAEAGCEPPKNEDDDEYALIQIDDEECTELDMGSRSNEIGVLLRKFNLGYDAKASVPEKMTAKRDLEERGADKPSSAPTDTSSASALQVVWRWSALLALARRWL